MLRKGDIEDYLKIMGKDVKHLNWKEKIKMLYIVPCLIYIGVWVAISILVFALFFFTFSSVRY